MTGSGGFSSPAFFPLPAIVLDSRPRPLYIVSQQHVAGAASPRDHPQKESLMKKKAKKDDKKAPKKGK